MSDSHDALADLDRSMEEAFERGLLELAIHRVEKRVKSATWQAFRLTAVDNSPGADAARQLGMQVAHFFVAKHRIR
jgi:RNA polymerase sigma-70 factor (ECF subfamily)